MRRAALAAALGVLWVASSTAAEPWKLSMEAGAGGDSNVERVESAPNGPAPIAALVGRAGARITYKHRLLGGGTVLGVSGLARMVASEKARSENVMLYTGDARWLRALPDRPIAAGVGITAVDALGIMGGVGARTFRNLGADALI